MLFSRKSKPPASNLRGLEVYQDQSGTLSLFPIVASRNGPCHTLSSPVVLTPPYVHSDVGKAALDLRARWADCPVWEELPPQPRFWKCLDKGSSYRSFHRTHRLLSLDFSPSEITLSYLYRHPDGGGSYGLNRGEVELKVSLREGMPDLPHQLGKAVSQIFAAAAVLDPLP